MLATLGVFAEVDRGQFALTALGAWLQTEIHGSLRPQALVNGELFWLPWAALLTSVQTGKTAFDSVHGMTLFEYLARPENTELAQHFRRNTSMPRWPS